MGFLLCPDRMSDQNAVLISISGFSRAQVDLKHLELKLKGLKPHTPSLWLYCHAVHTVAFIPTWISFPYSLQVCLFCWSLGIMSQNNNSKRFSSSTAALISEIEIKRWYYPLQRNSIFEFWVQCYIFASPFDFYLTSKGSAIGLGHYNASDQQEMTIWKHWK
jgi:hypothetical protein